LETKRKSVFKGLMMQPSTPNSEKKPFWKITVPKLPGSIKPLVDLTGSPTQKTPSKSSIPGGESQDIHDEEDSLKAKNVSTLSLQEDEEVYPDFPDTTLEQKLQSLTLEDIKGGEKEAMEHKQAQKLKKFNKLYLATNVDLDELRQLSWSGIPHSFRSWAWKLLMGYMPLNKDRRAATLERKRQEYLDCVRQYFGEKIENNSSNTNSENRDSSENSRNDGSNNSNNNNNGNNGNSSAEREEETVYSNVDMSIFHQIKIDVPRTNPDIKLYQQSTTRRCLERILYVWAIRHPASGYVQGINDLVTPFFTVFISQYVDGDVENCDMTQIPKEILDTVEADSYWCVSKLVDGIQDNYTTSQPGIQRQVYKLKELIGRLDASLHDHIQSQGIEFIQFSFRWMNCLLMRETSLSNIIRMWDTYMAEGIDGYSTFHLYVCAAFLNTWAKDLKKMDFAQLMTFLQNLPSQKWGHKEVEMMLSEAFMLKTLFHNAQSHLH